MTRSKTLKNDNEKDWYLAPLTSEAEDILYRNQMNLTNEGSIDQRGWTGAWFGAVTNRDGTNDYIWGDKYPGAPSKEINAWTYLVAVLVALVFTVLFVATQ